jgi:hypothetical protein
MLTIHTLFIIMEKGALILNPNLMPRHMPTAKLMPKPKPGTPITDIGQHGTPDITSLMLTIHTLIIMEKGALILNPNQMPRHMPTAKRMPMLKLIT